jgi:hypothetical protein
LSVSRCASQSTRGVHPRFHVVDAGVFDEEAVQVGAERAFLLAEAFERGFEAAELNGRHGPSGAEQDDGGQDGQERLLARGGAAVGGAARVREVDRRLVHGQLVQQADQGRDGGAVR